MRAGLTVNGRKSTFLHADRELYAEFDEAGEEISRYIRGNGLAGLEYRGKLYGVHRDEQLSTGWVTGEAGVPESAYEYDAFGMLLGSHEDIPNRLLYGGQQYDAETEQYYLRARYYNPVIGRFMQEDTYRGDGLNLYAYCANNPVMYYDPSGRNGDCNHATDAGKNAQQENVTVEDGGLVKDGLGKISGKKYTVTQDGLDFIKQYLTKQGYIGDYENQAMLNRLETALANGEKITGADAVFYTHEIKEAQLVSSGILQKEAHLMALEFYEVSPFSTYHPDVIKMAPEWWNQSWFEFWNIGR